jgi:hypothetical protein
MSEQRNTPAPHWDASAVLDERDRLAARVAELEATIRHVVRNSPGTPDSVKGFLVRALEGAWGEPYERAILSTLDSPEWAESPDRSEQ